MAEFPSLPLFTDAYMSDTRHLTAAQHGAYLLLLMTAWRMPDCALPDDDAFLSKCAAMDLRTWKNNRSTVIQFFQKDSYGRLFQPRLRDERNYVEHKRNKNAEAGRLSALKRKERHSTTVSTKRQHKVNQPTPTPSKENTPNGVSKKVGLDELKIDHIARWLSEKRACGKYLLHDEHQILETFKDYCKSKGKRYADYVAALRNSFDWDRNQPTSAARRPGDKGNPMDALSIALEDQSHRISSDHGD